VNEPASHRRSYSERQGRGPRVTPLAFEEFRALVARILDDLYRKDRLQEALGCICVDDGPVPGELGSDLDIYVQTRL
jgi:hypothetical protein